jgi:ribose-phosphate pyrophosphokinase
LTASQPPLLFALSESRALGAGVARAADIELAALEERSFEEGEFKLRPLVPVRDRTVFVVQSLASSTEAGVAGRIVRLLFLVFGLRDAGAARVIALVPYFAFARKDRRTQLRDPVTARYVAQLLEAAGVSRVVALDVHNSAAFDNAFRVPTDHLSALPMFVDHFARAGFTAPVAVASPDVGGIKRAQIFRELLERRLGLDVELSFIEKRRARGKVASGRVVGEVNGRDLIVLDDLCASGGTLIRAADALRDAGARAVHVAFTHAPLGRGIAALMAAKSISRIVLTDSAGAALPAEPQSGTGRVTVLPIAPLFGAAVARMTSGAPVAPLLERWPPADAG